jgi:uncharacterized damage-inducible protein DinB
MARAKVFAKPDPLGEVVRSFAVNGEINQLLIARLNPAAWQAKAPLPLRSGQALRTRTRTIAAIFAHMHNVRRKWIRLSAPHIELPAELDRNCTQTQARKALGASGARCDEMIEQLLTSSPEKEAKFLRDGWARHWPAGPMMVAYMITHEAHHRGQVCMLVHQLGFRLPEAVTAALWRWETLATSL